MQRYTRLHVIILGLLLASLFVVPASTSAKPKGPSSLPCPVQEQTSEGCKGPQRSDVTSETTSSTINIQSVKPKGVSAQSVSPDGVSAQTGGVTCLAGAYKPTTSIYRNTVAIGHGDIYCPQTITIRLRTCVQVGRWWGWQTLPDCIDQTVVADHLDQYPNVTALSGTYDYRTYVDAWITAPGYTTGHVSFGSEIIRMTFP